jgi:hypothetical protein
VLFVCITRWSYGKERLAWLQAHHEDLMEKARKVEAQDIDAELEYELQKSRDQRKEGGPNKQGDPNKPEGQKDQNKPKEG